MSIFKRVLAAAVVVVATFTLSVAPAAAAAPEVLTITESTKNCVQKRAHFVYKVQFNAPGFMHGGGRYMIKSTIKWQRPNFAGGWTTMDKRKNETDWVRFGDQDHRDFSAVYGDSTGWGNAYDQRWRVTASVSLYKNWPGPKDRKKASGELVRAGNQFKEVAICLVP